jgi:uncharacterized protein
VPAALLISGSGPLDRDSNMPRQVLNVSSALAVTLAGHGVASLRYDKRGVGASGGDFLSTGFDDETADARAALETLRSSEGVDGERVVVIGHSVGATIAIRIAAAEARLAGAVLLCAATRPGAEVMAIQSERIAASLPGPSWLLPRLFIRRQARARGKLRAGIRGQPTRWFHEYMAYDPASDLPKIRCPVLAVTGTSDIQVEPGDVARIGELVAGPSTGDTPEGLTHLLRVHPGPPSLRSYTAQLKRPVDGELLERVASWTRAFTTA